MVGDDGLVEIKCPLQGGRGIAAAEESNGADRRDLVVLMLQGGRGIAAAEELDMVQRGADAYRLQGGRGIAAAEEVFSLTNVMNYNVASMRPRHCCRGRAR